MSLHELSPSIPPQAAFTRAKYVVSGVRPVRFAEMFVPDTTKVPSNSVGFAKVFSVSY